MHDLKHHTTWISTTIDTNDYNPDGENLVQVEHWDQANLLSSRLHNGKHSPALDLDIAAKLLPSSTEGHFHLYLGVELSWREYKKLLKALMRAGIIEKPNYEIACGRKQTMLRKPGLRKPNPPTPIGAQPMSNEDPIPF